MTVLMVFFRNSYFSQSFKILTLPEFTVGLKQFLILLSIKSLWENMFFLEISTSMKVVQIVENGSTILGKQLSFRPIRTPWL